MFLTFHTRNSMALLEFQWLFDRFPGVNVTIQPDEYLERASIWLPVALAAPKAHGVLQLLTQADGWLVEHVRWDVAEPHLTMKSCVLVRLKPNG